VDSSAWGWLHQAYGWRVANLTGHLSYLQVAGGALKVAIVSKCIKSTFPLHQNTLWMQLWKDTSPKLPLKTLVLSGNFPLELAKGSFGELDNCVPKNCPRCH
jgi:hypothetical protein